MPRPTIVPVHKCRHSFLASYQVAHWHETLIQPSWNNIQVFIMSLERGHMRDLRCLWVPWSASKGEERAGARLTTWQPGKHDQMCCNHFENSTVHLPLDHKHIRREDPSFLSSRSGLSASWGPFLAIHRKSDQLRMPQFSFFTSAQFRTVGG